MNKNKPHLFSYLTALVIGFILFATFWKTFFGTAASPVVAAGIVGVVVAVTVFLIANYRKKK